MSCGWKEFKMTVYTHEEFQAMIKERDKPKPKKKEKEEKKKDGK